MDSLKDIAQLLQLHRKSLGMEQKDMYMRIGMKQQQYQRIESGKDIKVSTLLRVLEGLDLELIIAPKNNKSILQPIPQPLHSSNIDELADDGDDLDFWFGSEK